MGGLCQGHGHVQPEPPLQLPVQGDAPVPGGQGEGLHAGHQPGVPCGAGGAAAQPAVRMSLQEGHEEGASVSPELLEHPHGAHRR